MASFWQQAALLALLAPTTYAISLDIHSQDSIRDVAASTTFNLMSTYTANQTGQIPGKLPDTWWEGAALYNTLIQYWYFTGDESNNPAVSQGLYHQRGENNDYFPANWSSYVSNDDHLFWGLTAMTAAELGYPQQDKMPSWVDLAGRVFHLVAERWDEASCSGGLRSQIWPYQAGWNMKTATANGGLFQLAARLGRYTGNSTYTDWADKIWDWSVRTSLMDGEKWFIWESTYTPNECGQLVTRPWSINYGLYIGGAAYMYNQTNGASKWKTGLDGLLNKTVNLFFPEKDGHVLWEFACEFNNSCDRSENIYKGYLASWLAFVTTLVPSMSLSIIPLLQESAVAAAKQCSEASHGTICGGIRYDSQSNTTGSMEKQMSATNLFTANLVAYKNQAPLTSKTVEVPETGDESEQETKADGPAAGNETSTNPSQATASGSIQASSAVGYGRLFVGFVTVLVLGLSLWI